MKNFQSISAKLGLVLAFLGFFGYHSLDVQGQDAKIYEACPGTEIALHSQVQTGTSVSVGELGVPKYRAIYTCKEGGWCCPMEYA
ncbi:MAG: hypothetical protein EP311_00485 [Cytophagales bacterium]|uniref:Uncharacterized protein n=1 Tax=Algoriphagus taiwanensis TaxID=1445656 RepID=A0ABQ6PZE4_9BACT|nr:MAG: hypothetical protein EP311_00485 [Cytophagales bacterium]GMQ33305.1 hypothetical protein Ataiwa_15770 [Algoriphagus taiwanensis]